MQIGTSEFPSGREKEVEISALDSFFEIKACEEYKPVGREFFWTKELTKEEIERLLIFKRVFDMGSTESSAVPIFTISANPMTKDKTSKEELENKGRNAINIQEDREVYRT